MELEEPLTNCGCPYCDEARERNSQKTSTTKPRQHRKCDDKYFDKLELLKKATEIVMIEDKKLLMELGKK